MSHWDDVITPEIGMMVHEAIRRSEQAMAEEIEENGMAHQDAN